MPAEILSPNATDSESEALAATIEALTSAGVIKLALTDAGVANPEPAVTFIVPATVNDSVL